MSTRPIPTYEALALQLQRLGVTYVFGLMSDEIATLVAAIDGAGIRFISARHENNAVAMAEGYATSSGRLGVALVGRGPATANALHGIVYARKAGSRVLLMVGAPPDGVPNPNGLGPDTKALDAVSVLRGAGVRHMTLHDPATAPRTLVQAAVAARQGLMALLLPTNVLGGVTATGVIEDRPPDPPPAEPTAPRAGAITAAAALLKASRRPLILAGHGAHRAGARDALAQLADHLGAALATTMKAKDMFRGHPFDCGVVGSFSHGAGRRLIAEADCIVAFGAGLNQRTTSQGTSLPVDAPLIQVDTSREALGRWWHCDVGITADARMTAEALRAAIPPRSESDKPMRVDAFRQVLRDYQPDRDFEPRHTPRTLDPRTVGVEMDRLLPADRNVVYDAGNFLQCATYVGVPGPSHFKQASDFSSIGMGLGTALGFAVGDPSRATVVFIGDGAFLMSMSELETAAREGIPLVVIVMNDAAYGAELHVLRLRGMPVATTQFPDVDYTQVAEAFGFQTATVRTLEELRALGPLLAAPSGPILVDCKINGGVAAGFLVETAPAPQMAPPAGIEPASSA